jgi:hypothetical protein
MGQSSYSTHNNLAELAMKYIISFLMLLSFNELLFCQSPITTGTGSPRGPFVEVNPTNPLNLIAVYITIGGIGEAMTTNGGSTWSDTNDFTSDSPYMGESDPMIRFDGAGIAYVTYLKIPPGNTVYYLYMQKSSDGGKSWTAGSSIASSTNGVDRPSADFLP